MSIYSLISYVSRINEETGGYIADRTSKSKEVLATGDSAERNESSIRRLILEEEYDYEGDGN